MNEPIDNTSLHFDDGPSLRTRIGFASAWILIAVAGIFGNSLVIFVAVRFQKLHNVTNCFIVNLAITDIVFLAFCMPLLVVQYTLEHWYFNTIFCKLLNFISFVSVLVTVLTLVAMTIDRYIYVRRPFENIRWRKPKTVFLLSLIIWLLSCALASPFYHHYGVEAHNDTDRQCALLTDEKLQNHFRIYTVTLYYFIPLTIILISYTKLLYYVYSKENQLKPKTKHNIVKWSKKRRAVTKMVAIVTLIFSLCWLPLTLYIVLINHFKNRSAFLYYFKMIAHSFSYLNSAVNPIIYALLNRSFRNNCGSILARPTCSLFCGDDVRIDQQQTRSPSTKQDRYSQPTSIHQIPSFRQAKRKKKVTIINNHHELAPNDEPNNDFSDTEYDGPAVQCQAPIDRMPFQNYNSTRQSELLSPRGPEVTSL